MQTINSKAITLEIVIKDLLKKDLPALHNKLNKEKTHQATHYINHPQKTLLLTYNTLPALKSFNTLHVQATDEQGNMLYEIKQKHTPLTQKTQLQTKTADKTLSKKLFISHLIYLEQEKNYPITQQATQISTYIQNLLTN